MLPIGSVGMGMRSQRFYEIQSCGIDEGLQNGAAGECRFDGVGRRFDLTSLTGGSVESCAFFGSL